jgi:DNA-directed RNA polymerase II subunit RPB11
LSFDVCKHVRAADHRVSWVGTFTVIDEDHTVGQVLRHALAADPKVLSAGYSIPHPLENIMRLHVQTDDGCSPATAVTAAIDRIVLDLQSLAAELQTHLANRTNHPPPSSSSRTVKN